MSGKDAQPRVHRHDVGRSVRDLGNHAAGPRHGLVEERLRDVELAVHLREDDVRVTGDGVVEYFVYREVLCPTLLPQGLLQQRSGASTDAHQELLLGGAGEEVQVGVGKDNSPGVVEGVQRLRGPHLHSQRARRATADDERGQARAHVRLDPADHRHRVGVASLHDFAIGAGDIADMKVAGAIDDRHDGVRPERVALFLLVVDPLRGMLRNAALAQHRVRGGELVEASTTALEVHIQLIGVARVDTKRIVAGLRRQAACLAAGKHEGGHVPGQAAQGAAIFGHDGAGGPDLHLPELHRGLAFDERLDRRLCALSDVTAQAVCPSEELLQIDVSGLVDIDDAKDPTALGGRQLHALQDPQELAAPRAVLRDALHHLGLVQAPVPVLVHLGEDALEAPPQRLAVLRALRRGGPAGHPGHERVLDHRGVHGPDAGEEHRRSRPRHDSPHRPGGAAHRRPQA
mmetsp:Transcript_87512/g.244955  ORF Transcript_87512/g.244955 Transcript_87512/m.244955 type:complete len:458 (+) Transcript_87512:610-1983(+)